MQRGNGAVIGKQNTPTTSVATGVWALNEVQRAVLNGTWPAAAIVDPYFEYNTLLLHGNGTNGAQNNTFLDSSTNNFSVTRNGNTTQGTFTPYGSNWSNYFDGTDDFIYVADSSAFTLGSGDFTVEAWVWTGVSSTQKVISGQINSGGDVTSLSYQLDISSSDFPRIIVASGSTTYIATSSTTLPKNQWVHVAGVRDGSTLRIYVNGVQYGTQSVTGVTVNDSSANVSVGRHGQYAGLDWNGYISNFRLVKGTCVYPSGTTFTPSTAPLTAITNTSLLTCQSNRFIDNSSNNFTITRNGDVSVQRFSPFNPTAPYSAATIGGSGYFDGTGDYLAITSGLTNQFDPGSAYTFEGWFYIRDTADEAPFYIGGSTVDWNASTGVLYQFYISSGTIYWQFNSGGAPVSISGTAPAKDQWVHVAVGYNGTTTRLWVNGASIGTSTSSYTVPTYTAVSIGAQRNGGSAYTGYASNLRFVKGTDVYGASNTTITIPTSLVTAIGGTSLLCNFTNGGIIDNAMMNDLETVGNAQISTSVSKFGGGSMAFDGSGDGLLAPSSPNLSFGSGDFTVEGWVYFSGNLPYQDGDGLYSACLFGQAVSSGLCLIFKSGGSSGTPTSLVFTVFGVGSSSTTISTSLNTWYHIAVTKASGTVRVFLNGVQQNSFSNSTTFAQSASTVGYLNTASYYDYFLGNIDDLRITRGYARYTANFTPPTLPFPDQ